MDRQKAIDVLLEFAYLAEQEFSFTGSFGKSTIHEQAHEALLTLGVTEDEINNTNEEDR